MVSVAGTDARNILYRKDDQVINPVKIGGDKESVQLLTGPNGSGKTFYEKGVIASMLMAQSTGFVPAAEATMPIFDGIMYLDRVVEKQEQRFSSFSQEINYWNEALRLLQKKKNIFACVDEAFSTTSPKYQEAFSIAIVMEFLSRNHMLMLSTHNHLAVDRIQETGTKSALPYYFDFTVADGDIKYHRTLRAGHETSRALDVAQGAGLPKEIVDRARSL